MSAPSRRTFLTSSTLLAAAPGLHAAGDDTLKVGLIGCGGRGTGAALNALAADKNVKLVALADAFEDRLTECLDSLRKKPDVAAKVDVKPEARFVGFDGYKSVIERCDVVLLCTPPHFRPLHLKAAVDAGKHVFAEKPCAVDAPGVRSVLATCEAAKKKSLSVVSGLCLRYDNAFRECVKRIHGGAIGDVLAAKAWNSQLRRNLGKVKPTPPPAHIDFDAWLGPAPDAPFYANRVHGMWRFFRDYGAGDIGNDGVHNIDVAVWGLGLDALPNRVAALGGKYFFDDDQEWPDTQYSVCEFDAGNGGPKPRQLVFEQRIWSPYVQEDYENGNAFYGTKGMLIIGHTIGWRLYGPRNKLVEEMKGGVDLVGHHNNFIDAILKGTKLNAPATAGHLSAGICHLSNIATRLRQTVEFDPKAEAAKGDAQAMTRRKYRDGHWAVPKGA